ncbi:hypothetical protein ACE38W_17875 [Chitinophaga sp. Hz27]|uniref:hypothetical protein n=1 Tax=Chitinophaga sp. Hz27 TaxID=3347169 RepID=UPI0035E18C5D
MKRLIFCFIILFFQKSYSQISIGSILNIGRLMNNPYHINGRGYVDATDSLQLLGYPLTSFIPNVSSADMRFYDFNYDNIKNSSEKVVIENQNYVAGGVKNIVYRLTFTTNSIDVYNQMFQNLLFHPDFDRPNPVLQMSTFVSKPATGINEQVIFSKDYNAPLPSGQFTIKLPIVYRVEYIRR